MKFKYSVIGDNTAENRKWLEKLGYKRGYHTYPSGNCIFTKDGFDYPYVTEAVLNDYPNAIDCRNNPALFQAVTAMSDDTDNQQFFIHKNGEFILCWQNELKNVLDNDERYQDYCVYDCHKATLEELITHFKVEH